MANNLLKKVFIVMTQRPTVFLSYFRQTYLFFQTKALMGLFVNNNPAIEIDRNVRFQSLKNLMIESTARFSIGRNSVVYENARLEAFGRAELIIGKNSIIGDARITSRSKISIGDRFITSWNVFISDFDAHPVDPNLRKIQMDHMTTNFYPRFSQTDPIVDFSWDNSSAPIRIGSNVWIGSNVTILKGVSIGDNCIVASGSVVTKGEYPANSILAGNPAKVVKSLI